MTRRKLFMAVQAALCAVIAVLLAAGALGLYLDGAVGLLPLLNAADAMPQTIIVDRQGVVTYNAQAPLTYEKLEALYRQALE